MEPNLKTTVGSYEGNEDLSKMGEGFANDSVDWKAQMTKLMKENEEYKQENYSLHCKLETSMAMQEELREANEVLEQRDKENAAALAKRVREIEEKFMEEKRDFVALLAEMEADAARKSEENDGLQLKIKELNQKLQSVNAPPVIVQADDSELREQTAELAAQLLQKDHDIEQIEECLRELRVENSELREILDETKRELSEKNEQLDGARDDLMVLKIELAEVKERPASDTSKGNSLFAEVEDRRKKMLEQMAAMRKGYSEAKRAVTVKDSEIKALKAEKAAFLRKLENDAIDLRYQDAHLMEKYKGRISELELKLQEQQNKYRRLETQSKPVDLSYSFFQSMLDEKRREVEELETKLENVSIQAILEEEKKHKLSRQLRFWHWKAMSNTAQLDAIKTHVEANPKSSSDGVLKILQQRIEKHAAFEETLDSTVEPPKIAEESLITLEKLMKIPRDKVEASFTLDDSPFDSSKEDLSNTAIIADCDSSMMEIPRTPVEDAERKPQMEAKKQRDPKNEAKLDATGRESAEKKAPDESNKEDETAENVHKLKSALSQGNSGAEVSVEPRKEKKTLKFTDDTVDPPPRVLKRQLTPKYPIVMARAPTKK